MPSLAGVWSELESALLGRATRLARDQEEAADPFPILARVLFETATDARKAGSAVEAFREAGFLDGREFAEADFRELEDVLKHAKIPLRPTVLKSAQRLASWTVERGDLDALRGCSVEMLRDEIRGIPGIGSTTADAILLRGIGVASYPVDRATYRVLARHGWIEPNAEYDEARDTVVSAVGDSVDTLIAAAAAFERLGRDFCKLGEPKCERCPLKPWLPDGGPIQG